ncbi:MAG TPA: polysaccharide deacetylase family protein [Patescibacteria group bacterium]|nr:polysaccharide deacetylase family protein [Patescibacteria group bacterium]
MLRVFKNPQTIVATVAILLVAFGIQASLVGQGEAISQKLGTDLVTASTLVHITSATPAQITPAGQPSPPAVAPSLPPLPPKPTIDCGAQQCLALTFDDGPTAAITPRVLDILEKYGVHATFFVVGSRVRGDEALLQRMNQDGDEIGSHSWSHANLTKLSVQQIKDEVSLAQAAIMDANVPAPTIFRPPYGAVNSTVEANVPMALAMWNVDPDDWKAKSPQEIVDKVKANSRPGRVIVLHDQRQMTVDALDKLIPDLKTQYQLVTFSEMFNLAPGQRGYFYGR